MTPTTYFTERPAAMPMAAPVGAVVVGFGARRSAANPSAQHRATFANAFGNGAMRDMAGTDRKIWLTTTRSARLLGRPST